MPARSEFPNVYAQIVPKPGLLATGYFVRLVLVMPPDATTDWVTAHWGQIERQTERALKLARHEAVPELPDPLPPCLPIQFEAKDWMIDDPHVDLFRLIRKHIATVVFMQTALRERTIRN